MSHSRLFLIDAHALCYRSFFAIKNLSTSYGQPTNAVFGFISTLRKILREYEPEYMAVCFDVGKKTLRQERYAEYKIHRRPMPDDLISQIPLIKEAVKAYNLPIFELEGFEADDVIATLATKTGKDLDVVIVSGDKDMVQLLGSRVKIFNVHKDKLMGYKEAKESFGIDPKNITDYLGLAGDQSDNIPGVFGVGEVTARDLINRFGTIENMFAEIDKVPSLKLKEKLLEQKDQALFSKELATLDANVPLKLGLDAMKVQKPDQEKLLEFFRKLEFRKLADELAASEPTASTSKVTAKTLKTADDVQSLSSKIAKHKMFAFLLDVAKEGESLLSGGMAIALEKETFYIPLEKIALLKAVFEDEKILKITHKVKDAVKTLRRQDIELAGGAFDCLLAAYLIAPSKGVYDIETLAWDILKCSLSVQASLGERAKCIFDLYAVLKKELEEKSLLKLFEEIEIPLAFVLARMEEEGVRIDEELLAKLSKECDKKIEDLNTQLYKMAGMEFNLNSPKQLSEVLFQKLKLPVVKKTKTGFSTDEGVLVKLAEKHEFPALILDYRQLAKLKSTYIDCLPKLVDPKTGRIHTSFNQAATETGRLSSNDPNLQNIPIRTELGRQIRKAFIARGKGYLIISADYSQIELRILAHLSGDKNLIKAFQSDEDIHNFTAAQIFEVSEDKVTPKMRNSAKRVNFGIIYGMSAFGLSKDLNISTGEAQDFIDRYFLRYPGVKKFMDGEIKKAEKNGYVLTIMNRRRYLPEIHNTNMMIRQFAQRQAINTPVQGSAADLMKLAMINIQKELDKKSFTSRMIITVHDELVFDVPEKEKAVMVELIRRQMENTVSLSVPIKASIKAGENWLNMKEL